MFHLAVDAVDGDALNQGLQGSAKVLHTRTCTEREKQHINTHSSDSVVLTHTEGEKQHINTHSSDSVVLTHTEGEKQHTVRSVDEYSRPLSRILEVAVVMVRH